MAQESKQITKRRNPWKLAFWILLAIIVCAGGFLAIKAFSPGPSVNNEQVIARNESFGVTFNKKQINGFAKYYLNNQQKNDDVKYQFVLKDHAVVSGTLKFLNRPVQFSLICDPYVKDNGDVQLKAKEMAIGQLALPLNFVLGYINHNFNLPKWVSVNQKQKTIELKLNEFKLQNGMQFTAKKIDLKQDKIEFNVFLPLNASK